MIWLLQVVVIIDRVAALLQVMGLTVCSELFDCIELLN